MKINTNYSNYLLKLLPINTFKIDHNNNIMINIPKKKIKHVLFFLKKHTNSKFNILTDICGSDYPELNNRFKVIYNLLSIKYNSRIFIKINFNELDLIESSTVIYPNANWMEREVWDMFGIFFFNHPDLRRILTDYGFEGYPLRKDFPLSGFIEVRYDDLKKRIVYDTVSLPQSFRNFKYENTFNFI